MADLPINIAVQALQRLYFAFTGRQLPEADALRLIDEERKRAA